MGSVGVLGDCLELRFVAPGRPMSTNEANRTHWAKRSRAMRPWRDAVALAWKQARPDWDRVKDRKCTVEVFLPFPDKRRRDPANFVGTIVKSLVDELTTKIERYGKQTVMVREGCWPDDTPDYVEVIEPRIVVGTECVVRITPQERDDA